MKDIYAAVKAEGNLLLFKEIVRFPAVVSSRFLEFPHGGFSAKFLVGVCHPQFQNKNRWLDQFL